jgi:hypothetical protein
VQKKYCIKDCPDLLFRDLAEWSVVGPNGFPDYRYNDRELFRALADNSAATFEWLVARGVVLPTKCRMPSVETPSGIGPARNALCRDALVDGAYRRIRRSGRPKDPFLGQRIDAIARVAAKKAGVEILLEQRMTSIHRQAPNSGLVPEIAVDVNLRARKAVIIGTGGSTGNVNFRLVLDPRLTESIAISPVCRGPIRMPAVNSLRWRSVRRYGVFTRSVARRHGIAAGVPRRGRMPLAARRLAAVDAALGS